MKLSEFVRAFEAHVPPELAADWDNVGLLVGRRDAAIYRVMTTLDLTPWTLAEAVSRGAQLVVTHHPTPFRPLRTLTDADPTGELLLAAAEARVAVYSPHTAWDDAPGGINDMLATAAGLAIPQPLVALEPDRGRSRFGDFAGPVAVGEIFQRLEATLGPGSSRANCPWDREVQRLAVCCGSGGSMLPQVLAAGCDALLTGEATYHQCLEAAQRGAALLMLGHHRSESWAMRELAKKIPVWIPGVDAFHCEADADIIRHG